MELTKEQRARIEEIAGGLKCSKDFKCCKAGFEDLCKAYDIGFESLLECLEGKDAACRFSVFIADIRFCTCPLRDYIAKNIEN
jgi:hypothetical protein